MERSYASFFMHRKVALNLILDIGMKKLTFMKRLLRKHEAKACRLL